MMEAWWERAASTAAGAVKFGAEETLLFTAQRVSVYYGQKKVHRDGTAHLTTHRIVWSPASRRGGGSEGGRGRIALHLRHVEGVSWKRGFIGMSSPKIVVFLADRPNPAGEAGVPPLPPPPPGYVMLSFHAHDRDAFLAQLEAALKGAEWVQPDEERGQAAGAAPKPAFSTSAAGIQGIIRVVRTKQARSQNEVNDAFSDLDALMGKAKDMVALAERMAAVRDRQGPRGGGGGGSGGGGGGGGAASDASSSDESRRFDRVLQGMGLPNPVTKRTAGRAYQLELARQLADFLEGPIAAGGGMMELSEVYCRYNRARGTDLVSPDDVLQACAMFKSLGVGHRMRRFPTGVIVVQADTHSDVGAARLVMGLLRRDGGGGGGGGERGGPGVARVSADEIRHVPADSHVGALDVSTRLGVSLGVAKQFLLGGEQLGFLCRDESSGGLRFYANWFAAFL